MGTRGYQAWRFRKRYYKQSNSRDSYPNGLGRWIAEDIPSERRAPSGTHITVQPDVGFKSACQKCEPRAGQAKVQFRRPEHLDRHMRSVHGRPSELDYVSWLQAQRDMVAKWERSWEEAGAFDDDTDKSNPELVPSWFAPLSDGFIEWVYIIDLDREIFSINNSVHMRLDQVCHLTWIGALADARLGWKHSRSVVLVPGFLPEDAVTSVVEPPTAPGQTSNHLESLRLPRLTVKPKDITSFPWRQRHGIAFYHDLFAFWSSTISGMLAVMLLQWTPDDPPFREIAFATLCLALGGSHVTTTSEKELGVEDRYKTLNGKTISRPCAMAIGVDDETDCVIPECAPKETVYWFEGILIVLASQLFRPEALDNGVSRVIDYCQSNCIGDYVDAILMSIEHVVLIHIMPGMEVQHTALLPLISVSNHLSMHPQEIFTEAFLDRLNRRKQTSINKKMERHPELSQEELLKREDWNIFGEDSESDDSDIEGYVDGDISRHLSEEGVKGSSSSTFYALMHVFEAAGNRCMPPASTTEGRLPTEIYSNILAHVEDVDTRRRCLKVSSIFRTLCQESVLVSKGLFLEPWDAKEALAGPDTCPAWFHLHNTINSNKMTKVGLHCVTDRRSKKGLQAEADQKWKVIVGNKVGERSLVDGFQVWACTWE